MDTKRDTRLLNLTELATELNVGTTYTRAMKKAGLPVPGGRTTVSAAMDWLRAHPDFKVREALGWGRSASLTQ